MSHYRQAELSKGIAAGQAGHVKRATSVQKGCARHAKAALSSGWRTHLAMLHTSKLKISVAIAAVGPGWRIVIFWRHFVRGSMVQTNRWSRSIAAAVRSASRAPPLTVFGDGRRIRPSPLLMADLQTHDGALRRHHTFADVGPKRAARHAAKCLLSKVE